MRFTTGWLAGTLLLGTAWAEDAGAPDGELRACDTPTWRTLGTATEPRAVSLDLSDRIDDGSAVFGGELRVVFDFVPDRVRADHLWFRFQGGGWNEFAQVRCASREPCVAEAVAPLDLDLVDFTDGAAQMDIAQVDGTPLPVTEVCLVLTVSPVLAPSDGGGDTGGADEGGCAAVPGAPLALPGALLLLVRRRRRR